MNGTHSKENGQASSSSAKYQKAPQREEFLEEKNPEKHQKTKCEKCALSSCLMGVVCIVIGIISALLMKPFVHQQIINNMVLMDGGQAFLGWKDPPVTPILTIYFFNLTNKDPFLFGREKPRVEKIGPYVYHQEIHKVNVSFDETGEKVTFSDKKFYKFSSALSSGSEDDLIVMPNLPLLGALKSLGGGQSTPFGFFESILKSYNFGQEDLFPFRVLSVREFLWSYPSLIMSVKEEQACWSERVAQAGKEMDEDDDWDNDWDDWDQDQEVDMEDQDNETQSDDATCEVKESSLASFAFFMDTNGTTRNPRTVYTGKSDIMMKGKFVTIGGSDRLGFWPNETCNKITGRDPGTLSIEIKKDDILDIYFGSLCRIINFRYIKTVQHNGIDTYRFSPVESTFNNPNESPENSCYCSSRPCSPSGIADLSAGCKEFSPVYISWPHFLHGDPELREAVDGVTPPNRDLHSFYMDLQSDWGTALAVTARFQMNVRLENNGYKYLKNLKKEIYLPFLMLEEGVPGPNEVVLGKMSLLLGIEETAQHLSAICGIGLGFLLMIPEVIMWIRSCYRSQPSPSEV